MDEDFEDTSLDNSREVSLFEQVEDLPIFNAVRRIPELPKVGDRVVIRQSGKEFTVTWTEQYERMRKLRSIEVL